MINSKIKIENGFIRTSTGTKRVDMYFESYTNKDIIGIQFASTTLPDNYSIEYNITTNKIEIWKANVDESMCIKCL